MKNYIISKINVIEIFEIKRKRSGVENKVITGNTGMKSIIEFQKIGKNFDNLSQIIQSEITNANRYFRVLGSVRSVTAGLFVI